MSYLANERAAMFASNISACRFVLIGLVVFNHSFQMNDALDPGSVQYVVTVVTKTSVPVLSLLSGYLFARSKDSYLTILRKKVASLVTPFFLWNTLPFFLYLTLVLLLGFPTVEYSRYWLVNAATAFHNPPVNAPLYFLRDLFICFLVFGSIKSYLQHPGVVAILIGLLVMNYVTDFDGRIIIRNTVPLFFIAGVAVANFPALLRRAGSPAYYLGAAVAWSIALWISGHKVDNISFADVVAWTLASAGVVSLMARSKAPKWLGKWGADYSFTIFLSHWWLLVLAKWVCNWHNCDAWVFQWIGPLASIGVGVAVARLLAHLPNYWTNCMNGGRTDSSTVRLREMLKYAPPRYGVTP